MMKRTVEITLKLEVEGEDSIDFWDQVQEVLDEMESRGYEPSLVEEDWMVEEEDELDFEEYDDGDYDYGYDDDVDDDYDF